MNADIPTRLQAVPFWKRQRYWLEYWGLRSAAGLISLLPWRQIGPLASFVGSIFFAVTAIAAR